MEPLICVQKFRHWEEARTAKGLLESAGVKAIVQTDEGGGMAPDVAAESRLMVNSADEPAAREVLQQSGLSF